MKVPQALHSHSVDCYPRASSNGSEGICIDLNHEIDKKKLKTIERVRSVSSSPVIPPHT